MECALRKLSVAENGMILHESGQVLPLKDLPK